MGGTYLHNFEMCMVFPYCVSLINGQSFLKKKMVLVQLHRRSPVKKSGEKHILSKQRKSTNLKTAEFVSLRLLKVVTENKNNFHAPNYAVHCQLMQPPSNLEKMVLRFVILP